MNEYECFTEMIQFPNGHRVDLQFHLNLHFECRDTKMWAIFLVLSQACQQGADLELEQLGLDLVSVWNDVIAENGLALCSTNFFVSNYIIIFKNIGVIIIMEFILKEGIKNLAFY